MEEVEYLEEYEDVVLTQNPEDELRNASSLAYNSLYFEESGLAGEEIIEDVTPFQMQYSLFNDSSKLQPESTEPYEYSEIEGDGAHDTECSQKAGDGDNFTAEHSYGSISKEENKNNKPRKRRIRNVDAPSSDEEEFKSKQNIETPQTRKVTFKEKENTRENKMKAVTTVRNVEIGSKQRSVESSPKIIGRKSGQALAIMKADRSKKGIQIKLGPVPNAKQSLQDTLPHSSSTFMTKRTSTPIVRKRDLVGTSPRRFSVENKFGKKLAILAGKRPLKLLRTPIANRRRYGSQAMHLGLMKRLSDTPKITSDNLNLKKLQEKKVMFTLEGNPDDFEERKKKLGRIRKIVPPKTEVERDPFSDIDETNSLYSSGSQNISQESQKSIRSTRRINSERDSNSKSPVVQTLPQKGRRITYPEKGKSHLNDSTVTKGLSDPLSQPSGQTKRIISEENLNSKSPDTQTGQKITYLAKGNSPQNDSTITKRPSDSLSQNSQERERITSEDDLNPKSPVPHSLPLKGRKIKYPTKGKDTQSDNSTDIKGALVQKSQKTVAPVRRKFRDFSPSPLTTLKRKSVKPAFLLECHETSLIPRKRKIAKNTTAHSPLSADVQNNRKSITSTKINPKDTDNRVPLSSTTRSPVESGTLVQKTPRSKTPTKGSPVESNLLMQKTQRPTTPTKRSPVETNPLVQKTRSSRSLTKMSPVEFTQKYRGSRSPTKSSPVESALMMKKNQGRRSPSKGSLVDVNLDINQETIISGVLTDDSTKSAVSPQSLFTQSLMTEDSVQQPDTSSSSQQVNLETQMSTNLKTDEKTSKLKGEAMKTVQRVRKRPRIIKPAPAVIKNNKFKNMKVRKVKVRLKKYLVKRIFEASKKMYPKKTTNLRAYLVGLPSSQPGLKAGEGKNSEKLSHTKKAEDILQNSRSMTIQTSSHLETCPQHQINIAAQKKNVMQCNCKTQAENISTPQGQIKNTISNAAPKDVISPIASKVQKIILTPKRANEKYGEKVTVTPKFQGTVNKVVGQTSIRPLKRTANISSEQGQRQSLLPAVQKEVIKTPELQNVAAENQLLPDTSVFLTGTIPSHLVVETKLLSREEYMRKNLSKSKLSAVAGPAKKFQPPVTPVTKTPTPPVPSVPAVQDKDAVVKVFEKIQSLIDEEVSREVRKKLQQISEGFTTDTVTQPKPRQKKISSNCDLTTANAIHDILREYFNVESFGSTKNSPADKADHEDSILPDSEQLPGPSTLPAHMQTSSIISTTIVQSTPNVENRVVGKRFYLTSANLRQINNLFYASGLKRRANMSRITKSRRIKSPDYFRFRKIRLPHKHNQMKEDSTDSKRNVAKDHTYSTSPPSRQVPEIAAIPGNSAQKSHPTQRSRQKVTASLCEPNTSQVACNIVDPNAEVSQVTAAIAKVQSPQCAQVQFNPVTDLNISQDMHTSGELITPDNPSNSDENAEGHLGVVSIPGTHDIPAISPVVSAAVTTSNNLNGHSDYEVVVTRTLKKILVPTTGEITDPSEVVISDLILPDESDISKVATDSDMSTLNKNQRPGVFIIGDTASRNEETDPSNVDPQYTEEYSLDTGYQFKCQQCTVVLSSRPLIQDHVQRIHFNTSKNCYLCGVQLDQPHLLQHFLDSHSAASISR